MPHTKGTGAWKPADGDGGFALRWALRLFAKELFKGDFYTSMKMRALLHVDPRGGLFTQEHEAFNIMQQDDDGIIKDGEVRRVIGKPAYKTRVVCSSVRMETRKLTVEGRAPGDDGLRVRLARRLGEMTPTIWRRAKMTPMQTSPRSSRRFCRDKYKKVNKFIIGPQRSQPVREASLYCEFLMLYNAPSIEAGRTDNRGIYLCEDGPSP